MKTHTEKRMVLVRRGVSRDPLKTQGQYIKWLELARGKKKAREYAKSLEKESRNAQAKGVVEVEVVGFGPSPNEACEETDSSI
jgi:nucleotide-binding universal stress UspA family protein